MSFNAMGLCSSSKSYNQNQNQTSTTHATINVEPNVKKVHTKYIVQNNRPLPSPFLHTTSLNVSDDNDSVKESVESQRCRSEEPINRFKHSYSPKNSEFMSLHSISSDHVEDYWKERYQKSSKHQSSLIPVINNSEDFFKKDVIRDRNSVIPRPNNFTRSTY
jgi:hypothetical protein